MLELIADLVLLLVHPVIGRHADEGIPRDAAKWAVDDGPHPRQILEHRQVGIVLVRGQEGDVGLLAEPDGEGRGDIDLLVTGMVDQAIGAAQQGGDAEQQLAVLVHRSAEVDRALDAVVAADLDLGVAECDRGGPLAGQVDQAARIGLAIEGRGRAAQQLGALQGEGFDAPIAVMQLQPVLVLQRQEAAHVRIDPRQRPAAVGVAVKARRVLENLGDVVDAAVAHLAGGDHRDRAGQADDRRVALGGGHGLVGHEHPADGNLGRRDSGGVRRGVRQAGRDASAPGSGDGCAHEQGAVDVVLQSYPPERLLQGEIRGRGVDPLKAKLGARGTIYFPAELIAHWMPNGSLSWPKLAPQNIGL